MSSILTETFSILTGGLDQKTRELLQGEEEADPQLKVRHMDSLKSVPEQLQEQEFDLLLLDIDEADIPIERLIRDIQVQNREQAFIVLMEDLSYEKILFSIDLGALDFLRKPLDELYVKKILQNHRRRIQESAASLNLAQYVRFREIRISLPMDVNILQQAAHRITADLYGSGTIEAGRIFNVNLAIFECLTNALEHGNLGIGFSAKTEHIKQGNYLDMVRRMSTRPNFRDKKIHVHYVIEGGIGVVKIEDEGEGFDWRDFIQNANRLSHDDYHGRGLLLAYNMIDDVTYNDKGNCITLRLFANQN